MVVTCAVLLVAQCAWWRGSEGWVSGDTVAECTHFVAAEVPERQHVIMLGLDVCVCVCVHVYVCHMYVVLNIVHHTLTQDTVHIHTYICTVCRPVFVSVYSLC